VILRHLEVDSHTFVTVAGIGDETAIALTRQPVFNRTFAGLFS
jgi:hypothetical protein